MDNQALFDQAGEALARMGVSKSLTPTVMSTDSLAAGQFMNRAQVEQLVDLTVNQSAWLASCGVRLRSSRSGELPKASLTDVVTEGVAENAMATVSTHVDTDHVEYACKKYQATFFLTVEDIREAAASGESQFEPKIMAMFGKAMGNDMARAALRGDTTLDASTRLNRLLRQRDGWLKKLRASANLIQTTRGSAFAKELFFAMLGRMPEVYRDDPDLRFLIPSLIDLKWQETIAAYAATGSALGDQQLITRDRKTPAGIPQLIVPQIPTDQGFAICTGSTADPDVVTDDGDGTITIEVSAALGGYSASHAGRRVRVTYEGTGESEVLTVYNLGGDNLVATAGSLGQVTISETEADYTIDLADLGSTILTNPKNLFLVLCDKVRAYRRFEQEGERWRVDVFYESDFGLFNPDAAVIADGVISPSFSWGE